MASEVYLVRAECKASKTQWKMCGCKPRTSSENTGFCVSPSRLLSGYSSSSLITNASIFLSWNNTQAVYHSIRIAIDELSEVLLDFSDAADLTVWLQLRQRM